MSLLVIDFTYLEERDVELVVKELVAVDSHSNGVSSYVFKVPYVLGKFHPLMPEWIKLLTTVVIGKMMMSCIESWKLCYIARHHLPL